MKPSTKKTLAAMAIVATSASAVSVKADEVTQPVTSPAPVESTVTKEVTKADVDKATKSADDAKAALDAQAQVVSDLEAQAKTTMADLGTAEETPTPNTQPTIETEATEVAPQITSETIKPAVDETMVEVTEAEKNLADVENQTATAEETVKQAQTDVATAKEQVAKGQDRVNELEELAKEASPETIAQAEKAVETARETLENLKKSGELETASTEVRKSEERVVIANSDLLNAQNALKTNRDKLKVLNEKQSDLQAKLAQAGNSTIQKTVEKEVGTWQPDYSRNENRQVGETAKDGLYKDVKKDVETVVYNGERTETVKAKASKLGEIDNAKLNYYFQKYLSELRQINGITVPTPKVTVDAISYALYRTEEVVENFSHDSNKTSEDFGYFGEEVENISSKPLSSLGASEQEIAYQLLHGWFSEYYNTKVGGYGHRDNLLFSHGELGVAAKVDGKYMAFAMIVAEKAPTYLENQNKYIKLEEKTDSKFSEYYFKGKRVKFLPKITFRHVSEETVEESNPAWVSAKKELDEFNATITEKIAKAQADVDTAKANLTIAENNLNQAEKDKKNAQANLKNVQNNLSDANLALTQAQNRVSNLKNVDSLLSEAKQSLAESQQLLADAETRLSIAEANLETLKGILTTAKETLAEKQDLYNQLKDYYDKLVDIERLSVDNTVTVLEDGTIVAVPKTAPTATEKPEFDLNSLTKTIPPSTNPSEQTGDKAVERDNKANQTATTEMSETPIQSSYSRMEKNHKTLPETGSVESLLSLVGTSLLAGLGLKNKRRFK